MQEHDVEAILAEWPDGTATAAGALRGFLAGSVPDVDAWAVRRLGPAGLEPQVLAVAGRHLYRIASSVEDGRRALGFERLPLDGMTVALLEWRDPSPAGEVVRRRWTLRTREDGFTVETEQLADDAAPAVERVMRAVLERAG